MGESELMVTEAEWNGPLVPPSLLYWTRSFCVADMVLVCCRLYNRFAGHMPAYYWI